MISVEQCKDGYKVPKNIVIGCGRSGTKFLYTFLNKCGLEIGHETQLLKNGIVSWQLTFIDNKYGLGRIELEDYSQFDHILHLIRNPVDCINSMMTAKPFSWEYIGKSIDIKDSDNQVTKCAKYWAHWNKEAEKNSEVTVKIEDLENNLHIIKNLYKLPQPISEMKKIHNEINRKTHTRENHIKYGKYTIEKINKETPADLFGELIEYAHKHKYVMHYSHYPGLKISSQEKKAYDFFKTDT